MSDRMPPYDELAEQSVLGAMMLSKNAIWDVLGTVEPGDFYDPKHEVVYEGIRTLVDHERPVDVLSVIDELQRAGKVARAGGEGYVHTLTDVVITTVNAGYHATIVRDAAVRRRMIEAGERIAAKGYAREGDVHEQLEQARAELDGAVRAATTSVVSVGPAFSRVVDALSTPESQHAIVPTPWEQLNRYMVGMRPGALIVVGARPSEGKSIIGLQLARALAVRGNVAFSSLEMPEDEITQRLIASMASVSLGSIGRSTLTEEEWDRVAKVRPRIERMPLFVDDRSQVTITQIKSFARSVSRKGKLGGVVVDYLQLVSGTRADQKRFEVVSEVSRQLKIMARELECPVVALSQLNREAAGVGKMRRNPTLSDLRESGSIEQDADVVLLLQRQVETDGLPGPDLDIHVAKQRQGRLGKVSLLFEGQYARVSTHSAARFELPIPD